MARIGQGGTIPLDAEFTDGTGALVDPGAPLVDVLDALGVVVAVNVVTVRRARGIYDYPGGGFAVALDAPRGVWIARWSGTINGVRITGDDPFEVVAAGSVGFEPGPTYGASVDGVRAFLPHRVIDAASAVSTVDVERFLSVVGQRVASAIDGPLGRLEALGANDPTVAPLAAAFRTNARGLVELGAAAMTEDAGFPERSGIDATDSSYGAVLWDRFTTGLDGLAGGIDAELRTRLEGASPTTDAQPAVSGPPPFLRLTTRF